jgi:hypothetical protein
MRIQVDVIESVKILTLAWHLNKAPVSSQRVQCRSRTPSPIGRPACARIIPPPVVHVHVVVVAGFWGWQSHTSTRICCHVDQRTHVRSSAHIQCHSQSTVVFIYWYLYRPIIALPALNPLIQHPSRSNTAAASAGATSLSIYNSKQPVRLAENKSLKVRLTDLLWEKNTAGWLEISIWKLKWTGRKNPSLTIDHSSIRCET